MKIEFQILVLAIGLSSCTYRDNRTKNIVAKYKALDEVMSPQHVNCDSEVKSFKEMDSSDCSFKLDNDEFDIIEKFVLDDKGNLKEYWGYKSEGPLTYTVDDLTKDPKLKELINIDGLNVRLFGTTKIIDKGDTLKIEKIKDNLILVTRNQETVDTHIRYFYELDRN